jgi:hypothetical protein
MWGGTAEFAARLPYWPEGLSVACAAGHTRSVREGRIADEEDEGRMVRLRIRGGNGDGLALLAPRARQVFVNGRKMSCRAEGDVRHLSLPWLNNLEPCEGLKPLD